ncbi:VF530 family protein [Crocinitomicaceae bacterium]|nr:VF530 family protein [Crocinitomicaceae bacterium]
MKEETRELEEQPNNPLHGVKLADILDYLVDKYGFDELGDQIKINSFVSSPSIKSSLKFLRKTPWAREKVESFYLYSLRDDKRQQKSDEKTPNS